MWGKTDPDKEDFDIFRAINQIYRHIKQLTKKTVISKISMGLLGFQCKSDMKYIAKKLLPNYE